MSKNYATTTDCTSCPFKKDYSYYINAKCLECSFCYRNGNPKRRQASLLLKEAELNPNLFKAPITISKYCDPFYNEWATKNSLEAIGIILENKGQVILRTSQHDGVKKVIKKFHSDLDRIYVQSRCLESFNTNNISRAISPRIESAFYDDKLRHMSYFFDPLIIGLNDIELKQLLKHEKVNKIVIRQLFATDYFKEYLSNAIGKRWSSSLNTNINGFWTYDNSFLLALLAPVIEIAFKLNKQISFCGNPTLNQAIGLNMNCCLINNPIGMYEGYAKNNPRMPLLKA